MDTSYKNYQVNYEINAIGDAAAQLNSIAEQANLAQQQMKPLMDNFKNIHSYFKTLNESKALKDMWTVKPVIDMAEFDKQLSAWKEKALAAANEVRKSMRSVVSVKSGEDSLEEQIKEKRRSLATYNTLQRNLQHDLVKLGSLKGQAQKIAEETQDKLWSKDDIRTGRGGIFYNLGEGHEQAKDLREKISKVIKERAILQNDLEKLNTKAQKTVLPKSTVVAASETAAKATEAVKGKMPTMDEINKAIDETNKKLKVARDNFSGLQRARKVAMFDYAKMQGAYPSFDEVIGDEDVEKKVPKYLSSIVKGEQANKEAFDNAKKGVDDLQEHLSGLLQQKKDLMTLMSNKPVKMPLDLDISKAAEKVNTFLTTLRSQTVAIPVTLGALGEKPGEIINSKSVSEITAKATKEGEMMAEKANKLISQKKKKKSTETATETSSLLKQVNDATQMVQRLMPSISIDLIPNTKGLITKINNALKELKPKPITVPVSFEQASQSAKGKRAGNVDIRDAATQVQEQINKLHNALAASASEKPITLRVNINGGDAGFALNQSITRLKEQAKLHSIPLKISVSSKFSPKELTSVVDKVRKDAERRAPIELKVGIKRGTTGKQLNSIVKEIREQIAKKKIEIPVNLNFNNTADKVAKMMQELQKRVDAHPLTIRTTLGQNVVNELISSINNLKGTIGQNISAMKGSPKSKETYIGRGAEEPGYRKEVGVNRSYISPINRFRGSEYDYGGTSGGKIYGKGQNNGWYARLRAWAYPLTGNTSFGATTPAAITMMKDMGSMMAVGSAMGAVGSALHQAVEYQNTMKTVQAILQTSDDRFSMGVFNNMAHTVRNVGKQTKFTAPQVADAARFMAMAGLSTRDINNAIRPVADVALIGDTDLGTTADKLTNVMTTFGLKSSQMRDIADIMTSTFTRSNTDMMMLAESAKYAGGIAHLYGGKNFMKTFSDTMAMFGVLGNAGIQASSAGTTIRMMYQNLMQPNKNQVEEMKKYHIYPRDKNGRPLSMVDILEQIHNKVPQNKMADVIGKMFRITAQPGAAALATHIDDLVGGNGKVGLINANRMAMGSGVSAKIADEKKNTLSGLMYQASSAFGEAVLQAVEHRQGGWAEILKKIRDFFASPDTIKVLSTIVDLVEKMGTTMFNFIKIWAKAYSMAPGLINSILKFQMIFTQIGFLLSPIVQLAGVIHNVGGLIGGMFGGAGKAAGVVGAIGAGAGAVGGARGIGSALSLVALDRINGVNERYVASGKKIKDINAATQGRMEALELQKMRYERYRNSFKNSVKYKGHWEDISPLWLAPMGTFDVEHTASKDVIAERQRVLDERKKYANTAMESRLSAVPRVNQDIARVERQMQDIRDARNAAAAERNALFAERNNLLKAWRSKRQLQNAELIARYANMGGNAAIVASALRQGGPGMSKFIALNTTGKFAAMGWKQGIKDAFKSGREMGAFHAGSLLSKMVNGLKSLAFSLLSGLSKAIGLLASPIGLATTAIAALAVAGYKVYENWKKFKQETANNARTEAKAIGQQQSKNLANYQNLQKKAGIASIVYNPSSSVSVLGKFAGTKAAKKETSAYNKFGNINADRDIANKALMNSFNEQALMQFALTPKLRKKYTGAALYEEQKEDSWLIRFLENSSSDKRIKTARSYETDRNMDAADVRRRAALIEQGATSTATLEALNKIRELRKELEAKKITANKYYEKANAIRDNFNPQARGVLSADNYSSAQISGMDATKFDLYRQGAYNVLNAEIQGQMGTLSGYLNGIKVLKSKVQSYSNQWWNAINHVITGMGLTVGEGANAVRLAIKLLPDGVLDYSAMMAQMTAKIKGFKASMTAFTDMATQIYAQLGSMGLVRTKYYSDWIKFAKEQNKHTPVHAREAGAYWDRFHREKGKNIIDGVAYTRDTFIKKVTQNRRGDGYAGLRQQIRNVTATESAIKAKRKYDALHQNTKNIIQNSKGNIPKASSSIPTGSTSGTYGGPAPKKKKKKSGSSKDYASSYGGAAQRPTQVIINIDKLAAFDRTTISKNANDEAIARAVENKIAEAIAMLSSSALNTAGAVIAQGVESMQG